MASPLTAPAWRNRVQELRYVSPRDLDDHPLQHKMHPDQQRSVMRPSHTPLCAGFVSLHKSLFLRNFCGFCG